jgi:DNA-binding transcriptional regulator YdaS (Cro superfamily)
MSIQKFLTDIYETGMSDYAIAKRLGTSQPQINRMRLGKNQTSYERGEKIKKLAQELRPDIYPPQ